jgi:hypothetical protein
MMLMMMKVRKMMIVMMKMSRIAEKSKSLARFIHSFEMQFNGRKFLLGNFQCDTSALNGNLPIHQKLI